MNEDAAHDCLADLGKLGVIQFTDVSVCVSPRDSYAAALRCQRKICTRLLRCPRMSLALTLLS